MSWSILVVVGDGNGYVGAGIGKARAIPDAIRKGVEAARKSLVHVPMVGSTIPHDVLLRQGGAEVLLSRRRRVRASWPAARSVRS